MDSKAIHQQPLDQRQELQALVDKYRLLLELRCEREAYERQGILTLSGEASRLRQQRARHVAHRFPGALRELEWLTSAQLEMRLHALEEALHRQEPLAMWIKVVRDFHAALRDGLAIKRWLVHRRSVQESPDDTLRAFTAWYTARDARWHAGPIDKAFLARYEQRSGQRLSKHVWSQLAAAYGCDVATLKQLIFGDLQSHV